MMFKNYFFSFLLSLFLPILATAQTNIVFDLDGTLIQGLPYSKMSMVKKARTFQVHDGRYFTYVTRPGAKAVLLGLLKDSNFIVHICSTLPQSRTDLILNEMLLGEKDFKKVLESKGGQVFYADQTCDIGSLKDPLLISSSPYLASKPSSRKVFLGQFQYYFDSYDLAKKEISSLSNAGHLSSHQKYLPEDEKSFDRERSKLSSVYFSLLANQKGDLSPTKVQDDFDSEKFMQKAAAFERAGFKEKYLSVENNKCVEKDFLDQNLKVAPPLDCVKELGLELEWKGKSCQTKGSELNLQINFLDCIDLLPVEYRWTGPSQKSCQAFNNSLPLGEVEDSRCSITHALYNSATGSWESLTAFPGIEAMSTNELLQLFTSEPIGTISEENPRKSDLANVRFPRTGELLWRAMARAQYDEAKAISAMLGDPNANIESKVFTHIRRSLEKRPSPFSFSFSGELGLEFSEAMKQAPLSPGLAVQKTKKLMATYFDSIDDYTEKSTMLDYASSSYLDWNPFAIFSSISPAICHYYGYPVLVSFLEKEIRSVDLNYYNYVENSFWNGGYGSGSQADVGEFFTPSHVEANEITGFFQTSPKSGKIGTSLLKVTYKGRPYIAGVVSPKNLHCLAVDNNEQTIRKCDSTPNFYSVTTTEAPTRPTDEVIDADFLIKLCKLDAPCDLERGAAQKYGLRKRGDELSSAWKDMLKDISINGHVPKIFYIDERIPANKMATRN